MIKIGITGQSGFIGTHLYNTLGLNPDLFECLEFKDEYFSNLPKLEIFVKQCEVIVHLAAMNRHEDPQIIYDTNIKLVKKLIEACEATCSRPKIIFSSSTQEEIDNLYGRSKKEGRELFIEWAEKNDASFTGLIIPNVFGPFGNPFYNSVVATFCHQMTHQEKPVIKIDGDLKLIYVGDLIGRIIKVISTTKSSQEDTGKVRQMTAGNKQKIERIIIPHSTEKKVSDVLNILQKFKSLYFDHGIIPEFKNKFELDLFNTFRSYIDLKTRNPIHLKLNSDIRGSFIETIKSYSGGQFSYSTTKPEITRGNHFHTRKIERFVVIKGKARIQLRRIGTEEILDFELSGEVPSYVDMPIWYTHNIKNIGEDDLYTLFWINELFDPDDTDTFFKAV